MATEIEHKFRLFQIRVQKNGVLCCGFEYEAKSYFTSETHTVLFRGVCNNRVLSTGATS